MANQIIGRVECFGGAGTNTGSLVISFVNLFNFLTVQGPTVGIQRIAYNSGSQLTGQPLTRPAGGGIGYFDSTNSVGANAWGVWRFNSASIPFDLYAQMSTGVNVNNAPATPSFYQGSAVASPVVGFAACWRLDGSGSWGGSTLNNGNDTKSDPVWNIGNSSGCFFPRSNEGRRAGSQSGSRQNTSGFQINTNNAMRAHFFATKDAFVWAVDISNGGAYTYMYVGPYVPFASLSSSIALPAVAITTTVPSAITTQYGPPGGSGGNQGTIALPNLTASGSAGMRADRYGTGLFQVAAFQPNITYPTTASWDEFPILVGADDTPIFGALGFIDNELIREVFNIGTHDTNSTLDRVVIGGTTTAAIHLTMPFHTGTTPGSGATRDGVNFSIP
jgi:hypothetical protein